MLQELMAKKVSAWDRMMDSKEVERRTDGLNTFRQLSDEEVNLANRTFSKKRLQEFIDLKLKCFDQLINETDRKHRGDQLKQIQELGESEMSLVRGVGPKSLFQELAEQADKAAKTSVAEEREKEEKLAKQKVDQEKEKTEKTEPNDRKATEEEKRKQVEEHPQAMVRLVPPGMMLPAGMSGMRPGAMPSDMPGMVLNVTDHAMREGQVPGAMGGMPPEALIAMQQSRNAPSGAYMAGLYRTMPPMAFPHFPMMPPVSPEYRPCMLPHVGVTDQTARKEEPVEAKHTKSKSLREPPISDIDQKLKLLVQLEAARNVLQNRPSGTESSTADEFRNRLRRINRMQMQVVDDIMGKQGDLTMFDFMPELQKHEQIEARTTRTTRTASEHLKARTTRTTRTTRPVPEQLEARTTRTTRTEPEQLQARTTRTTRTRPVPEQLEARTTRTSRIEPELPEREESDESDSSTESEEEEVEKETRFKESRRFVTLHVPQTSEADVKVVPAVQPRADSPHRVCTGTSRLCSPANKRPLQDDSWEDSKSVITFDIITLINSDNSYPYYGPPRAPPADCAPYEFYNDSAPHYHDVPPVVQSAPQQVFYDPVPRAETSFAQTNCAAQSPQFFAQQGAPPVEFDVVFRGEWNYQDNVGGVGGVSGDVYGADGSQLVATSKEPDLLSNNVVPVGRPEAAVQTEAAEKKQAASNVTTQPTQTRPLQVAAAVQVSIPELELQQGRQQQEQQEVATKQQGSPDSDQFAKMCRDSLLGIAASVDNLLDSLNSLQTDRPRRTRRYGDKVYDDDVTSYSESDSYSDYDDDPPRGRKGKSSSRSPERRRKSPESKHSSSVFSWLCGSVCTKKPSAREGNQGDARLIQVANRIRELVQKVVYASNEVIEARKAIQQSGMLGQEGTQNVFAAEDKLWNLINLEGELADGLSQYRLLDTSSNKEYCESLQQAEDKIRQLIEVETKLATEIGAWRQMTKQGPFTPSYTRTNESRRPDSAPGLPPAAVSVSWRSGRRTAN